MLPRGITIKRDKEDVYWDREPDRTKHTLSVKNNAYGQTKFQFGFLFYKLLTSHQEKTLHHGHRVTLNKFKYFLKLIPKGNCYKLCSS